MWKLIHRTELEKLIEVSNIRRGQMLRIEVKNSVLDITGVCVAIKRELVVLQIQTGSDLNEIKFL